MYSQKSQCKYCGVHFTVKWEERAGLVEREPYFCPSCDKEVGAMNASLPPWTYLAPDQTEVNDG